LVNDVAEILGVLVDVELVELCVDVVDDELPHAATPNNAVTPSAAMTALLFSKRTIDLPLSFLCDDANALPGSRARPAMSLW
jgi:hypothetical protein